MLNDSLGKIIVSRSVNYVSFLTGLSFSTTWRTNPIESLSFRTSTLKLHETTRPSQEIGIVKPINTFPITATVLASE